MVRLRPLAGFSFRPKSDNRFSRLLILSMWAPAAYPQGPSHLPSKRRDFGSRHLDGLTALFFLIGPFLGRLLKVEEEKLEEVVKEVEDFGWG